MGKRKRRKAEKGKGKRRKTKKGKGKEGTNSPLENWISVPENTPSVCASDDN